MTNIAVIDVETTGLNPYRSDRIVEIAAVVTSLEGELVREFITLVNPGRDIGPTYIHGLNSEDILDAPKFGDIAGVFLETLDGCVAFAGHNIRFDQSFLDVEFKRLGAGFPDGPSLCTMKLSGGGSLSSNCQCYGIAPETQKHSALHDARATARLLSVLLEDAPRKRAELSRMPPIKWPKVPKSSVEMLTRDASRQLQSKPADYIEKLLARVQPELPADIEGSAISDYTDLLDRVIEDRHIDAQEGASLIDVAERWGLSSSAISRAHNAYLLRLMTAALEGGVSEQENRDLRLVARLLGVDSETFNSIMTRAIKERSILKGHTSSSKDFSSVNTFDGKSVCFTGECLGRLNGHVITREMAQDLAAAHGMTIHESVTKKLDILIVADPLTQSGKASKARQYGIRIIHEPVLWRALGLEVQ
ncbi:DNA polymerase III, epsilon subunit or related 3'-5' exonuclease [Dehalogenimonas alkenigignens]|uniref:DNA polymerase III, epsilon subunit or related 3'-5' exonuclease n=1 Tax=Dehalogenimonas alkenigignens TaxID=1217799 RepID=A0A0W0GLC0_9CHLR|nr:exonuclease domain-containing protein [Dehalogenimonas alkenigignens]KTB49349.1 DNA polymerase III, epsilon subunit or related 3'-5' exonuclease [Dehalogenimonas alkenigignens]